MAEASGRGIYLVDASPYIFRAHFSLPSSIRARDGSPAAATYGFTAFLLSLIDGSAGAFDGEPAAYLQIAFDRHLNSSFRNELYADYKAQRDLPPPELEAQIDTCFEMAEALGAATYIDERYEADDLIATAHHQLRKEPNPILIVTSDKDLAQLVDERTTLFDAARNGRYTPAEVKEKFGVRPDQIVDYLALAGDAVDNIPGVKGVGAKTAAALLERFGTLANLYEKLDEVPTLPLRGAKSLHEKLAQGRESAFLSRTLSEVHADVPGVKAGLKELTYRGADKQKVEALFERLGFKTLRQKIQRWSDEAGA